jgi:uncharacterized membrane protein
MSDANASPSGSEQPRYGSPPPPPPPDGPAPSYTAPYPPYPYDPPKTAGLSTKVAAGLAYFTVIPAVFFLLLEPYRDKPLLRFHSWQSIFLFIVMAFARETEKIFDPVLPSATAFGIGSLCVLLFFTAWLVATIKAFQGSTYRLPLIGKLAASTAANSSRR